MKLRAKIIGFLLFLAGVVLNSIEIQILRTTANKPFYEKILLSLTICDLTSAVFGSVYLLLVTIFENEYYCNIWMTIGGYGACFSALVSLMHLIFISFDRFWAICAPLHHMRYKSMKKLVIALTLSWGLPTLFMLGNIAYIIDRELTLEAACHLLMTTIFSIAAKIILTSDFAFLFFYSVIIGVTFSKKKDIVLGNQKQQSKFKSTLVLCMSIVLIFITLTTPFVVAFLTTWDRPRWFELIGEGLFVVSQISNSIVFLIQKYRSKRSTNAPVINRSLTPIKISVNDRSQRSIIINRDVQENSQETKF